jgi:hypothetical protein
VSSWFEMDEGHNWTLMETSHRDVPLSHYGFVTFSYHYGFICYSCLANKFRCGLLSKCPNSGGTFHWGRFTGDVSLGTFHWGRFTGDVSLGTFHFYFFVWVLFLLFVVFLLAVRFGFLLLLVRLFFTGFLTGIIHALSCSTKKL